MSSKPNKRREDPRAPQKPSPTSAEDHTGNQQGAALAEIYSLIKSNQFKEAEAACSALLNKDKVNAGALSAMAHIKGRQGDTKAKISFLRQATAANPLSHILHYNLGNALKKAGMAKEAIKSYQESIRLEPSFHQAYSNLGNALREGGKLREAASCYRRSLSLKGRDIITLNNLGNTLLKLGELSASIGCFRNAIAVNPGHFPSQNNLAKALLRKGMLDEATEACRAALLINPNAPDAYNTLGSILRSHGDYTGAQQALEKALELNAGYAEALNNLGVTLQDRGDLDLAIQALKKAIAINPGLPDPYNNLGNCLRDKGSLQDAALYYEKALKIEPSHAETNLNLSLLELLQGNYEKGWKRYEWRLRCSQHGQTPLHAKPNCKLWDGENLDSEKTLLIISEQGLGDILLFTRFVITARRMGLRTSLCAPSRLHGLLRASGVDDNPLSPEEAANRSNAEWIPLMSLPAHLDSRIKSHSTKPPYLQCADDCREKWRRILNIGGGPIIGINWKGNRKRHQDRGRSIDLAELAPVASATNGWLVSLQYGDSAHEIETCPFRHKFHPAQSIIDKAINDPSDIHDYAGIVANCDLIITSATTLAHLVGAMGRRAWVLVPYKPDWRWGLNSSQTAWYPSLHLFRQPDDTSGWGSTIKTIADMLRAETSSSRHDGTAEQ